MIARHREHRPARRAKLVEPGRGLFELLDPGALGEIAADDDQVRLLLLQPGVGAVDDLVVLAAEMNVGEMRDPGHEE